jgi:hypothetical protein
VTAAASGRHVLITRIELFSRPLRLRSVAAPLRPLGSIKASFVVSGEWLSSKEGLGGEDDPAWFVIGILVGDLAGLLLAVSIVLAAIATWRSKARLGRLAGAVAALAPAPLPSRGVGDDGQARLAEAARD